MNRYVFIIVICLASCAQQPKPAPPLPAAQTSRPEQPVNNTLIWIHDMQDEHDSDYVRVSWQLESDSLYNRLLTAYINDYENDGNGKWSRKRIDSVAGRPSFIRMALIFWGKKSYGDIDFDDAWHNRTDLAINFLFPETPYDSSRLYIIADTLLTQDNFWGIRELWNKADLKKLPAFEGYVRRLDTTNFEKLTELAAFFHNRRLYSRRDSCMVRAQKIDEYKLQYRLMTRLLEKKKSFDFNDYEQFLFGDHRWY